MDAHTKPSSVTAPAKMLYSLLFGNSHQQLTACTLSTSTPLSIARTSANIINDDSVFRIL